MSTSDGKHADLNNPIIDTFLPYTEIAIGGGNPLSHPDLESFLRRLKNNRCFPSMTVNQTHFMKEIERLSRYRDEELIYGLGVSLTNPTEEFAEKIQQFPNAVVHVIAGIVTIEQLKKMSKLGIQKILILGYKQWGRGIDFFSNDVLLKINTLRAQMKEITKLFDVVSFDNLAIQQLEIKNILSEEEWNEFYMGNDGGYTMYIDLVKQEYAKSSTSAERFSLSSQNSINDMFLDIRRQTNEQL